jgi:hypothetical protein
MRWYTYLDRPPIKRTVALSLREKERGGEKEGVVREEREWERKWWGERKEWNGKIMREGETCREKRGK